MTIKCISRIIHLELYYTANTLYRREGCALLSFEGFRLEDGIPIYLQITLFIKRAIVAGNALNGDELPSRRTLSALLSVNPNTVQKAYKLLEDEHVISSQIGAKSFIHADAKTKELLRSELLENDIRTLINSLEQMGLSKQDAIDLINKYWRRNNEH